MDACQNIFPLSSPANDIDAIIVEKLLRDDPIIGIDFVPTSTVGTVVEDLTLSRMVGGSNLPSGTGRGKMTRGTWINILSIFYIFTARTT